MYALVMAAAVVRVFVPLLLPEYTMVGIVVSGILWSVAFATFTIAYWPILTQPALRG